MHHCYHHGFHFYSLTYIMPDSIRKREYEAKCNIIKDYLGLRHHNVK